MKISLLSLAALLLPAAASADETFRCGKWIATSSMTVPELTEKCGQPASRDSRTEDVKSRNANNGLMVKVGETTVETWTYDRGANPAMVVTIVDGRIKSIERQK
jgi:hypothetical protein